MNQKTETKEVETLTEKVTIEIHKIGSSVVAYLPKGSLKAIPSTAIKIRNIEAKQHWLVDFSIRRENGKTVLVLESNDNREVNHHE